MKKLSTVVLVIIASSMTMLLFQNCGKPLSSQVTKSMGSSDISLSNFGSGFIAPTSKSGASGVRILPPPLVPADNPATDYLGYIKEYRHKIYDRYFYTKRDADQRALANPQVGADWVVTGNTFSVYETNVSGSSPLCRFYNSVVKSHFYTADISECARLKTTAGYVSEGEEGFVVKVNAGMNCPASLVPVYRAYSNTVDVGQKRHRYVAGAGFINLLVSAGWQNDGLVFCVPQAAVVSNAITPANSGTTPPAVNDPTSTPPPPQAPAPGSCTPGSRSSAGCPSVANGTSSKICNSNGTGYESCIAECTGNYVVSGATLAQPTCVAIPRCPSGTVQCGSAGFNLAQTEFSIDCGEDGYNYTRDTGNGNWNYLGVGIIQNRITNEVGPACCMSRDGSRFGCQVLKIDVIPTPVVR